MNLSCYLIDDESHSIEVLERYVVQTPGLELSGKATDPLTGLEEIFDKQPPNIVFLDVDMPQMNGLDVAELIRSITQIVFTTSYREYGPEAFEKNAADYLLKPINYDRFLKCISKIRTKSAASIQGHKDLNSFFFVKSNIKGKFNRVVTSEIRYIENIGNYISIYTGSEKITTYLTLTEVLTKLPEQSFSRIHQSYVINHACIRELEYGQVRLFDDISIPIGVTFRTGFREKMHNSILTSKRDIHSA